MNWRSLNGKYYEGPIEEILEEAIQREYNLGNQLKICVGTDSQVYKDKIEYATVVVVLREGRGGFMFIKSDKGHGPISIKERMLIEVSKSIEIAYKICPVLEKYSIGLEVHADINTDPQFKSHPALKEAMGYILGMGYAFKAKPDAFASSSCANKVV